MATPGQSGTRLTILEPTCALAWLVIEQSLEARIYFDLIFMFFESPEARIGLEPCKAF